MTFHLSSTRTGFSIHSLLVLAICLLSLAATALAQQTPSPVQEMGFARVGSKLYIQGGKFETNGTVKSTTGQLFSLDLAIPWSTAAPAWKSLAPGRQMFFMNAVSSPDNSSFYTIYIAVGNAFVFTKYNINLDQWSSPFATNNDTEARTITRPVINPQTGLVYLDGSSYMNIFDLNSQSMVQKTVPPNTFTSRLFSGAVFNAPRNSVMYFGGLNYTVKWDLDATYVTEYNIALNTWSNFTTKGEPPSPRADFCMQSNDDGTKIVVFGGRIPTNTSTSPPTDFTGTLHILDVPTGQWTQGPSGDIRLYMACVIVGDQFIAWGGSKGGGYTYDGPPVIFDLTKMQWVTNYTPPAYLLNAPKTTIAAPGATSSGPQIMPPTVTPAENSNLGAILGGAFGSLFVIALAVLIYVYVLRRKDKVKYAAPVEQTPDGDNGSPDNRAADGHGRRDPQEIVGLTHQTLDRSLMYPVNLDSKDHATNSIVATSRNNYTQINPGFVANNVPMLYAPQTGYTPGPVVPGGVIVLPNGQQANVVYLTQHSGPGIPPISNGTVFNSNMASYGNNTVPSSQFAYGSAIFNTSGPMPLCPTTTQQYMDGFIPLTNPPQHSTVPVASVVDHVQMPDQSPLNAQQYAGAPGFIAPAPVSLASDDSALSTLVHSSIAHDRQAYVGGQSASSLSRNRNNRRRSSALSIDSELKSTPSSGAVTVALSIQEGSQYYTAESGFGPGQTSEVNVSQNQTYQLPPPIPRRIS